VRKEVETQSVKWSVAENTNIGVVKITEFDINGPFKFFPRFVNLETRREWHYY